MVVHEGRGDYVHDEDNDEVREEDVRRVSADVVHDEDDAEVREEDVSRVREEVVHEGHGDDVHDQPSLKPEASRDDPMSTDPINDIRSYLDVKPSKIKSSNLILKSDSPSVGSTLKSLADRNKGGCRQKLGFWAFQGRAAEILLPREHDSEALIWAPKPRIQNQQAHVQRRRIPDYVY